MKLPNRECKRCGIITKRPRASCWFEFNICAKCYDLQVYHNSTVPIGSVGDITTKLFNPVEEYHNWVTREWLKTNSID